MDVAPYRDIRWLPYRNDSGETVPAYALLRITGVEAFGTSPDAQTIYVTAKPNASTTHLVWGFADSDGAASGGYGLLTFDFPAVAKVNTGAAPVNSETWGPSNGQWYIVKSDTATMPLVVIHGKTTEQGDTTIVEKLTDASAQENQGVGTTALAVAGGGLVTVNKYRWFAGAWTSLGTTLTARNTSDENIHPGSKVWWFYHTPSLQYLVVPLNDQIGVGQSTGIIAAGAAGSVTLYNWVGAVWTSTGGTETMRNTSGVSIASGKKVSWMYHVGSLQYLCSPLEC